MPIMLLYNPPSHPGCLAMVALHEEKRYFFSKVAFSVYATSSV